MEINFESIIGKVTETAKNVGGKVSETAKTVGDKAGELAKRAKLSTELGAERNALRDAYAELGKAIYPTIGEDAEGEIAEKLAKIRLSLELIAAKEAELEELRNKSGDSVRINIGGENPEMDEKIEEVRGKVADAVEAVKEKAGELSDKAGETLSDLIEKGAEKVEELKNKTCDTAENAAEEVVEVVEEASEEAAEAAEEKTEEKTEE